MLRTRVIPCLQLIGDALVKTVKFGKYGYIGDPINTVRIFNELEVDELCFLDIRATVEGRLPNLAILRDIADECFMPLSYGGGIRDIAMAREVLAIGFEKIVVNSRAFEDESFVSRLADLFGCQSIIGSIDAKRTLWGKYEVYINDGTKRTGLDPAAWAVELQKRGAGELLLTSMDQDGTWNGYDLKLLRAVSDTVTIPVIASGGAGKLDDISLAVHQGRASALALGSMVVYQAKNLGVLVNFPDKEELNKALE
jgi:cyclase